VKNWLLPATALMNRLNYMQKFVLIGLLLILPSGLFIILLIGNINKEIASLNKEKQGIEYIAVISKFIEDIQQHRGMSNARLQGDRSFEEQLVSRRSDIEADILLIQAKNEPFGDALNTGKRFSKIDDAWKQLKNKMVLNDADLSFALHSEIISVSLALIDYVSSTSGLNTDRHKESFYLVDALIGKLLAMLEQLGQTRGITSGVAADKQLGTNVKTQLTILSGMIRSALESVNGSLRVVYEADPMLQQPIQKEMEALEEAVHYYLSYLDNEIMNAPQLQVSSSVIFNKGTSAIQMGFALHDNGLPVIDRMLQQRMNEWAQQRMIILAVLLAACLAVAYLFLGLYRSVISSVHALNQASSKLAEGDLSARVKLDSRDELLTVGNAYNDMAEAFESIWCERKAHEEQLKHRAYHDQLTGLPNRVYFQDQLGVAIEDAQHANRMMAVLFIDLDRFKVVNDTLGHKAGDLLLQTVANRLSNSLENRSQLFRMGGDEFTAILPLIGTIEEAAAAAERMITDLDMPVILDSHEFRVSASIGISVYPFDGDTQQELLKKSDVAMYFAKKQGRNGYQLFDPALNAKVEQKLSMEMDLRKALQRGEFCLYYQPRVNLRSGQITTVEALIRWNHPELGLIAPGNFIPLAEETGLIRPIGEWVLRTACNQSNIWRDEGVSNVKMAVNISGVQFQSEHFLQEVAAILMESDFDPHDLEFELTESVVMINVALAISKMKQLREQGIRISIDDFGTGFSSLSYLKYFPVDILKIDRSFVKDIPEAPKDTAITKTIIALARRLGLDVVAEGVETEEQMTFLRSRNCNEAQGYLLSKPLPVKEITEILQKRERFIW
jgi:diguanylate cyclase (GGDEF)-like protein